MLQELEQPIHSKDKRKVIEAIRSLGPKVIPADVAAAADLPVLVTTAHLNRIASETSAHLEVSEDGAIRYSFDPRFEQAYLLHGTKHFLRNLWRISANVTITLAKVFFVASFFLLRISIGLLLIASVVVIIVVACMLILRLLSGSSDSGDSGFSFGDGGGGGADVLSGLADAGSVFDDRPFWSYWAFDWLWDWTYYSDYLWGPRYGYGYGWGVWPRYSAFPDYWDDYHYAESKPAKEVAKQEPAAITPKKKSRFLDNCFTLLFGSGDPNFQLEERRWKEIAHIIRANLGVITSEQVAPFLDAKDSNEDWMIPVLIRFNGVPQVTDSGSIIYTFPSFQQHAQATPMSTPLSLTHHADASVAGNIQGQETAKLQADSKSAQTRFDPDQLRALYSGHLQRQQIIKTAETAKQQALEPYLKEELLTLGNIEREDIWPVLTYAGLATFGAVVLLTQLRLLPFQHILCPVLACIAAYGSLFFLIPGIRMCINDMINPKIAERNDERLKRSLALASPSVSLRKKLEEARNTGISALRQDSGKLVYTTQSDLLEQELSGSTAGDSH
jgi:hypothetical protein